MNGIDPYAYLQLAAMRLPQLHTRREIETVLDEIEYLFEVIPPDLQDNAEQLIALLRARLAEAVE